LTAVVEGSFSRFFFDLLLSQQERKEPFFGVCPWNFDANKKNDRNEDAHHQNIQAERNLENKRRFRYIELRLT